jgi:hypothetical protein
VPQKVPHDCPWPDFTVNPLLYFHRRLTPCLSDELIQFAKLNLEVCPIIFRAKEEIRQEREEQNESRQSNHQRTRRKEKKRREEREGKTDEEVQGDGKTDEEKFYQKMLAEGLAEEAARRRKKLKQAEKRRVKREKAWLYAHQHLYVKIKGRAPYCAVCREKHDQNWLDQYLQQETIYQANANENLTRFKETKEAEIRDMLEEEHLQKIEKERKERVQALKGMTLESDEESEVKSPKSSGSTPPSDSLLSTNATSLTRTTLGEIGSGSASGPLPPLPPPPKLIQSLFEKDEEKKEIYHLLSELIQRIELIQPSSLSKKSHKSKGSSRVTSRQSAFSGTVPQYIIDSGLAYIDPNGKTILPTPMNLTNQPTATGGGGVESVGDASDEDSSINTASTKKSPKRIKKKFSRFQDDSEETEEEKRLRIANLPNATTYDLHKHEILLKFWNIEYGEKADFLGYALIPMEVLLHPPKGARSFPLESDPQFVKPGKEKIFLHGSVFVKITPVKLADMRLTIPDGAPDPHQLLLEKRAQLRSNRRAVAIDDPEATAAASSNSPPRQAAEQEEDDVETYYLPNNWRFQIYRATKMTAMHPIEKNSTMCEVCWKGGGKKYNEKVYSDGFLTIGETSVKTNTVDPDWRNDPTAVFELPPVWTDCMIPKKYEAASSGTSAAPSRGRGGWVAKNHLEEIERQGGGGKEATLSSGPIKESDKIAQILMDNETDAATAETRVDGVERPAGPKRLTAKLRFQLAANKVMLTNKLGRHSIIDLEVRPPSLSVLLTTV